ncbi:ABC transporter ATP-binding protein [Nocardioides solisilvae]|uniref:ABC transporter ATP-binding protein n=1 Tax=Nocardioides solisilvae TaxID=1542435 RepID=UPI000D74EFAF|nr:ABC transporter ATP-binding protein [Nocardioides solisilvae]
MAEAVIETRGLRKVFGSGRDERVAVDDLDLLVGAGGVHGFLGPNGSGKTTTIRMLLGLARATGGEMRLFGTPVPERLPEVVARVGAVVESPKFSPRFSGRQNLTLLSRSVGLPDCRVDAALETVGLADRDRDAYQDYSLGMQQRLAIAATLLREPRLLVLDEPTNGLDPAGIREIRETVRDLGASGVTVLLSSHILAEVQQVCDVVTIIGRGRLLASGRVEDLLGGHAAATRHRVVVDDAVTAAGRLRAAGLGVEEAGDALLVEAPDGSEVARLLGAHGLWVRELTPVRRDLESVFLELTSASPVALGGGR